MHNLKHEIAAHLAKGLEGVDAEQLATLMEYPPNADMGDLSLPCFRLSKMLRKAPQAIAEELNGLLATHDRIERVEAVSGYLNAFLKRDLFATDVVRAVLTKGERYGSQTIGVGKTVVVDYSSPNIAKPFHIGHLRSTVIGGALKQIFRFLGYEVVGVNHLGDWGTQFGKLIVAYKNWGSAEKVESDGITELLRLYVLFHDEADKQPELEDEARAWFVKLELGDEEANRLWRWFVEISLKEFQKIYGLLGSSFESYAGESFYIDKWSSIIDELRSKGLLEEDDGASIVRLDEYNMAPALMLKKDGSSLYHTRDVAAAFYRKQMYQFDKCIYVTDYAQNLHFAQWFKIIELMGYGWSKDLLHVPFGRVSLEGAGLSTRKGNVIKLEELLTKAIDKSREIIEEKNPGLVNKEEVARQIGVGAIVFNDLSANRIKDIVFSWEDALNFEGETGPYVQYAHARACSLLRKANGGADSLYEPNAAGIDVSSLVDDTSFAVLKELYLFQERIVQAMEKLEPSIISRYLVDLAQTFNRFYRECPILVEDLNVREARLALVASVRQTIQNGLALIGIQAPERM
jgi:arginyl-tRNA synthetase